MYRVVYVVGALKAWWLDTWLVQQLSHSLYNNISNLPNRVSKRMGSGTAVTVKFVIITEKLRKEEEEVVCVCFEPFSLNIVVIFLALHNNNV